MRKFLPLIVAALLPAATAFAGQPGVQKSGNATASSKVLPLKDARPANSCAAYGAGFVRVEGTGTCVKIGGAVSIGAGVTSGSR